MAQVDANSPLLSAVPLTSVDEDSNTVEVAPPPSAAVPPHTEGPSEVDHSGSSPDSGHEEPVVAHPVSMEQPPPPEGYWPQQTVMEPIAINPETGFTTVMVDPTSIPAYQHAPPAWAPGPTYSIPGTHLHPPPPPHYCSFDMAPLEGYAFIPHYETLHPHYEGVPYDVHCPPAPQMFAPKRNSRGGSLSPKRPSSNSGRSASQGNGNSTANASTQRGGGGTGGRYTPSPSSAGSRGSSPGQTTPSQPPLLGHPTAAVGPAAGAPPAPNPHVVHLHVNLGETISLRMGGQVQVIQGPATVRMVSTMGAPPIPLPVQVPPGHVLQQIVDESGTLRHVILSPAQGPPPPPPTSGPPPAAPIGVLPPHPPPPPPHFAATHNVGQPPPHFYTSPGAGYGPQGPFPGQYGPTPMGPNIRPHPHGHPRHHNQGPSSPPPVNLPNERAQRQALKLRKKFEQKLVRNNNGPTSGAALQVAPVSPKKDNNNVRKLKDRNQDDVCKDSSTDNKESANDQHLTQLAAQFTEWSPPEISEVTSRTALVSWKPVETLINENKLEPEVLLAVSYSLTVEEKGKENKSSLQYQGKESSYRVGDLHPATDYNARLSALVNSVRIKEVCAEFRTGACPPDAPLPPKVAHKTRNSLQIKWTAPNDNGSHITQYLLECDDGSGQNKFTQVYGGKGKQFTVKDLKTSTCYAFRLAAANQVGQSEWSDVLLATTLGSAPPPPSPPILRDVGVTTLGIGWNKSPADQLYTLQILDPHSGYGFRNEYHGPENLHVCEGLERSTPYKFRLQAQNEDGQSRWSEEVVYSTLADRPSAPCRVQVKGKIHAHQFRLRWDRPVDDGGSEVTMYFVEVDDGQGFRNVWSGPELECTCDKLSPGTSYRVRVACLSSGGRSEFSDSLSVTTEPVCPAQCPPPALQSKARPNCLNLKWGPPEFDGGAMITQYELVIFNPDGSSRIAYVGRDLECLVPSLLPGRNYAFQVRAFNRVGAGPWSSRLEVISGAGFPEAPEKPQVASRSPHSVLVSWEEPPGNGAAVSEYRLEMSSRSRSSRSGSVCSSSADEDVDDVDVEQLTFAPVHTGPGRSFEVKNLQPASQCFFRVQASNSVGLSPFSPVAIATTLASSPAAVTSLRCDESSVDSLTVTWVPPCSNGSPITHYNVEIADRIIATLGPDTTLTIDNLQADTLYRVRVQAVNSVGTGPFSPSLKASTRSLPPSPPRLECVSVGHNWLKLRWGDNKNTDFIQYTLELLDEADETFSAVYRGPNQSYKVTKLAENSSYHFRINAANDAGQGPYSPTVSFDTTRAPMPIKAPTITNLTETSCCVNWIACKLPFAAADQIVYEVKLSRTKDSETLLTKRVSNTELSVSSLKARTEYSVRVCPIRLCDSVELPGVYSSPTLFTTPSSVQDVRRTSHVKGNSSQGSEKARKPLSDWDWFFIAFIALAAFVATAILIAFGLASVLA